MQSEQLEASPHWPNSRLREKSRPVLRMPPTEALRNQHFNFLAQQLFALMAEELLHLRVDQNNLAGSIHHDHRVGRCLEQLAELPLDVGRRRRQTLPKGLHSC